MTEKLNILFYPGGGLGDTVVSLPVLYAIHEYFGAYGQIDIITGQNIEALREIYHGIPFIGDILPCPQGAEQAFGDIYDVVAMVNEMVNMQVKPAAHGLAPDFVQLLQTSGLERRNQFGLINHVHNALNNQLGNHAVLLGLDRRSLPLYTLGLENYLETVPAMQLQRGALTVLAAQSLTPRGYITVQDGWDANFPLKTSDTRPTKVWSATAWAALVAELKARHPDKKIVQLGSPKTGSDIAGVDLNLRGKISLREALAILKYAALHVDTEGGLVHMARGMHTRSLVLFGPTNEKFFGYRRNKNLVPPCNNCWWLTNDWMSDCLRGLAVPECMTHHTPAGVADAVSQCLMDETLPQGSAQFSAPPVAGSSIGIVNDSTLAAELASAGNIITHFDLAAQKNIHRASGGMRYRQYLARASNLPLENQALDYLYFTADENTDEFAGEILEALRVLKIGGTAIIKNAAKNIEAFINAGLTPPGGIGEILILRRTT